MQGASDSTDNKPKVSNNAIVAIIALYTGYSTSRWEKINGAEGNWKLLGTNKDKSSPLKDKKKLYRRSEKTHVKVFYVGIICSETLKGVQYN